MATELAKGIKFQQDLDKLTGFMIKRIIETVSNDEMAAHLNHEQVHLQSRIGYSKNPLLVMMASDSSPFLMPGKAVLKPNLSKHIKLK